MPYSILLKCYLEPADVENAAIDSIRQRPRGSETPKDDGHHTGNSETQHQYANDKRCLAALAAKALFALHVRARLLRPLAFAA